MFGRIDRDKAKAGKALFMDHCASCHNAWPYTWTEPNKYGKRFVLVGLMPQTYVGTDPAQFDDLRPFAITGALSNYLAGRAPRQADPADGRSLLRCFTAAILETALSKAQADRGARSRTSTAIGNSRCRQPPEGVYKAAPRDGVWATPPFMHNGSVPNLYEMLIPAKERTKKFYLGREFDPVKVGLDTTATSGKFLLDTDAAGKLERRPLVRGWPARKRRHRPVADRRRSAGRWSST